MISVREAKTFPKTSCQEWRDKFICVEGKHSQKLCTSCIERICKNNSGLLLLTFIYPVEHEYLYFVSEPFDRTNTARAVHDRFKFEAIKEQFIEVSLLTLVLNRNVTVHKHDGSVCTSVLMSWFGTAWGKD